LRLFADESKTKNGPPESSPFFAGFWIVIQRQLLITS
jgi:hypothetical protein